MQTDLPDEEMAEVVGSQPTGAICRSTPVTNQPPSDDGKNSHIPESESQSQKTEETRF